MNEVSNPYTREKIPVKTFIDIERMIRLGKALKREIVIQLSQEPKELTVKEKLKMKIVEIFQKIDDLGFITDCNWFTTLSRLRLYDLWRIEIN